MLIIQDPTNQESTYMLESLLRALENAEKVGGAFSFATSAGVHLLTDDPAFQSVASDYPVDLVVGIDAVTDTRALDSLSAVATQYPRVTVRAFLNPWPDALFHPKFCWTKGQHGGHLISGSANLTESGLLGNWEAYSFEVLDVTALAYVESAWDDWTARHAASLLPLDHPDVRSQANANNVLAREGDLPTLVAPRPRRGSGRETQGVTSSNAALVAEIPRSGDRWKQANFHRNDYVHFFGVREGTPQLFVFRHVRADGTLQEYERDRPPVSVESRNFRFELAAASGVPYPDAGRPIGVFVRLAARTFLYHLLLPTDPQHLLVSAILDRSVGQPGRAIMRTVQMTVARLRHEWPDSPLLAVPPLV